MARKAQVKFPDFTVAIAIVFVVGFIVLLMYRMDTADDVTVGRQDHPEGSDFSAIVPDKTFSMSDIQSSPGAVDVNLYGNVLTSGSTTWNFEDIAVEDPATLEYLGLGLFKDSKRIYSTGYVQDVSIDGMKVERLDASKPTSIATRAGAHYLFNGNTVYAFVSDNSPYWLQEVKGADRTSFEVIGYHYAKDSTNVYYDSLILPYASPRDARLSYEWSKYHPILVSGNKVFWHRTYLEGIDADGMSVDRDRGIVRDEDTIWYATGNCHFINYRVGTFDELDTYRPPC